MMPYLESSALAGALPRKRVLLVGAGGLGSPVAILLARAAVGRIEVVDDDRVDATNLHRQTLYGPSDLGEPKARVAARRIEEEAGLAGTPTRAVARESRVYPAAVPGLLSGFDLVVEGADNYPTKFLIADACRLAGIPCVQAGAVRWGGWALGTWPGRTACLRCVFEDVPEGPDRGCSVAGVLGPVVGAVGAIAAAIAIQLLAGRREAAGYLHHYQALGRGLRRVRVARRERCPLCSGAISDIAAARYLPPGCAA